MASNALIADIDNTLFDWPAFFAPSFRAMVHALARTLDVSYDQLVAEFRDVYRDKDSLEFSFSIQELKSVRDKSAEAQVELIRTGRGAFRKVSRLRLQPYPGVISTLQWLEQQDFKIVCVTNSPAYLAQKRLYDLGIDKFVEHLVAWEGVAVELATQAAYNPPSKLRSRSRIKTVKTFSKRDAKPSSLPFEIALESCGIPPSNVWAIGDSVSKDLAPASAIGIKTIWARYGAHFDPLSKDAATLLSITNWSDEEIKLTHTKGGFSPDFVVDEFKDVRRILPEFQSDLFQN